MMLVEKICINIKLSCHSKGAKSNCNSTMPLLNWPIKLKIARLTYQTWFDKLFIWNNANGIRKFMRSITMLASNCSAFKEITAGSYRREGTSL